MKKNMIHTIEMKKIKKTARDEVKMMRIKRREKKKKRR